MANPANKLSHAGHNERALAETLVEQCNLSTQAQQDIFATMQNEGLGFAEAAQWLGLVNADQVEDALVRIAKRADKEAPSLVETALNKLSRHRTAAITEGIQLSPGKELLLAHDSDHPRSEQLRALRTELLLLDGADGRSKTFATISPGSGEGRSQLAAELAIAFSQLGRRTLLIDADLRKPRQHQLFNSENQYGLSQALLSLDSIILSPVATLPYLAVLTSGALPTNPLELLSDGRLARLMDTISGTFDFIIMDTPPISKFADGLAVATIAGRVLLTSRAMHTTFSDVRDLQRRLGTTRAQVMGAVLGHF
jgi:receptor protein-tyrosine kinase